MTPLLILLASLLTPQDGGAADVRERLQGAWEEVGGERLLRFAGDRSIMAIDGGQSVFAVDYGGERITRRPLGLGPTLTESVAFEDGELVLGYPEGHALRWRRLPEVPDALRIEPFALGTRTPDAAEVIDIRRDLAERWRADQQPRLRLQELTDAAMRAGELADEAGRRAFHEREDVRAALEQMRRVDESNVRWLIDRLRDVGWIDAERFGAEANSHAFLLAQHSMNLSLMRSVLPRLEREARADPRRARHFAMIYDRTRLQLGEPQRYGTQVFPLGDEAYHVIALEDPTRVDARRAELGLGPLEDELAVWREAGARVVVDGARGPRAGTSDLPGRR